MYTNHHSNNILSMKWFQKVPGKEKDKILRNQTYRNIGNVGYFSYLFLIPDKDEESTNNAPKAIAISTN